jgi:hypothetical protein
MKNIVLILTLFLCTHTMYAMGLGDWYYKTNNGTTFNDPGGGISLWTNHTNIELWDLTKWYFYKDHIIGEYQKRINDKSITAYFILNELNGELKTYNNKDLFEKYIQANKLKPIFWTRWYQEHLQIIEIIYILCFFYWPIIICIALFIFSLIYAFITSKNKALKMASIVIALIILMPPILLIINNYYTNSI